jgi:hypothetical protein
MSSTKRRKPANTAIVVDEHTGNDIITAIDYMMPALHESINTAPNDEFKQQLIAFRKRLEFIITALQRRAGDCRPEHFGAVRAEAIRIALDNAIEMAEEAIYNAESAEYREEKQVMLAEFYAVRKALFDTPIAPDEE